MTEYSVLKIGDEYAVVADDQAVISFNEKSEAVAIMEAVIADDAQMKSQSNE